MPSWAEFEAEEPEFAQRVQALFDAYKHKTMATIRRDGSPRISGIELSLADGEAIVGMGPTSAKGRDVQRDNRVAIHSGSPDPPEDATQWPGDAKIAGRIFQTPNPEAADRPLETSMRYRVDVEEVVLTKVGTPTDHLVIESWHAGRGYRLQRRA